MRAKYELQAKRPSDWLFTDWCDTNDYETVQRNIKVIESYGYRWRLKGEAKVNNGDIYLNKYASEGNPSRVFIVTSSNNKIVFGKCEKDGQLERVYFPKSQLRDDTDHYIKIGNLNVDSIIAEKLAELRGASDEQ